MKKISTLIAFVFFASLAHSQTFLSFCTWVNGENQECVFDNTRFITSPDSTHGRLFMMLRGNKVFGTVKLTFKVYEIDRFGAEVLVNTLIQEVKPDWMNSWQPATFVSPGKYMVKVYTDDGNMLTSRGFEFFNL